MPAKDARVIVPLMGFATATVLVGHAVEPARSPKVLSHEVGDAQVILGGVVATTILTLIALAGDVGSSFAKGIALVALLAAVGNYGGSVATALGKAQGQVSAAEGQSPAPTKGKAK